jgi:choline dehydrogenase
VITTPLDGKGPAEEFDYVIVGGGTAGCVLANRLSADGQYTVLVLEAGERDSGFWIPIPAGFGKLLVSPRYNWKFETEPEDNVHGRRIVVPRGKGLGGSTLINGMIFVRGQARDFDLWAQEGATGWSFADVLPYFRKLESYAGGDPDLRGTEGPLSVVEVAERSPLSEAYIAAAQQAGYRRNSDYNGAEQEGFGYYQVNQRDGRRWSASRAYLRPALTRPNLMVRTGAHVLAVTLGEGRASGVC